MLSAGYIANGGAIGSVNANVTITECAFLGNNAYVFSNVKNANGGAVFLKGGSHTITDNIFTGNSATHLPTGVQVCWGGAVYVEQANAQITYNEFRQNLSHGSGGALHFMQGTHFVSHNLFTENEAIGNGGAFSCSSTTMDVVNNLFTNNSINGHGGAIYSALGGGTNRYVNNTFYGNRTTVNNAGGGIYLNGRTDHILNCIFWNNEVNGSTIAGGADVTAYNSNNSTFLNNTNQSTSSPINPLLTDAANGDFSLSSNSPCINAGNNAHFLSTYGNEDYIGNRRIYANTIDIGAIEYQGNVTTGISAHSALESLQIFPNPANNTVMITYNEASSERVNAVIYTLNGTEVKNLILQNRSYIDVSDLAPGVHIMIIKTEKERKQLKLVKL